MSNIDALTALAAALTLSARAFAAPTSSLSSSAPQYSLTASYEYPTFFSGFTTFTGPDPTDGFVNYTTTHVAKENDLMGWIFNAETNATTAFVSADPTGDATEGRKSVRLTSKRAFEAGTLTVIDVLHMPVSDAEGGAGLWPAVWCLGVTDAADHEMIWPNVGEQDIIEYVNPKENTTNAMTLHTGIWNNTEGVAEYCNVDHVPSQQLGTLQATSCTGSQGCSVSAPEDYQVDGAAMATAGPAFNAQGGGVYVHHWTTSGINIWLFPRTNIPEDIRSGNPDPSSWTQKPLASFSGAGCNFEKSFQPQQLIINVDVCGQWAGNDYPGGWSQCNTFAGSHPEAYEEAYFEFGSIRMYAPAA